MPSETSQKTTDESFEELKRESDALKQKIDEERKKHAMPINSSLGDPNIDAQNADGHNDLPEEDDDD